MAKFKIFQGRQLVVEHLYDDGPVVIGSGRDADIRIDDTLVAPRHAVLHLRAGLWVVEAADRRKPLKVDGHPTTAHALRSGDRFELGSTVVEFEDDAPWPAESDGLEDFPEDEGEDSSTTIALSMGELVGVYDRNRQLMKAHLHWHDTQGEEHIFVLDQATSILGSRMDCDVRLHEVSSRTLLGPATGLAESSGHFARILREGPRFVFEPLVPGILVNDLPFSKAVPLDDGDRISLAEIRITFRAAM